MRRKERFIQFILDIVNNDYELAGKIYDQFDYLPDRVLETIDHELFIFLEE